MNLTLFGNKSKKKKDCRVCHSKDLEVFIDLGVQPLANNLVVNPKKREDFFPLRVQKCNKCNFLQLDTVVNPDLLFKEYLYYSSTSPVFQKHFADFARDIVTNKVLKKGDLVVDIGSNDGILLKPFKEFGMKVLGVEPCEEIASYANEQDINTVSSYFTEQLAEQIVAGHGQAKLVTATNVFAHVDDVDEILRGVKVLLDKKGIFVLEFPDTEKMLNEGTFDLIYHEHLSYFTKYSITRLLMSRGFHVVAIEEVPVHGGSLRVFASHYQEWSNDVVKDGYVDFTAEAYYKSGAFQQMIEKNKEETLGFLRGLKAQGKTILGFGAPAKMAVMTNFYGITTELIPLVIEDSKYKIGRYTPGKHLLIVWSNVFEWKDDIRLPDYMFLFAWNFQESIIKRLRKEGYKGKFIIPFPRVHEV